MTSIMSSLINGNPIDGKSQFQWLNSTEMIKSKSNNGDCSFSRRHGASKRIFLIKLLMDIAKWQ